MHRPEIVTIGKEKYYKATWPRRIAARLIDLALVAGVYLVAALASGKFLLLAIPVSLLYLVIGNGLFEGASLGKALTGLVVLDAKHGCPCSVIQDLVRQRYLFCFKFPILLFIMLDSAKGEFDKPEVYVVRKRPLTAAEREEAQRARSVSTEKPARLDLAAMRASLQKPRDEGAEDSPRT